MENFWDFDKIRVKYLLSATVILLFAQIVLGGGAPRTARNPAPGDTVPVPSRADAIRPDTSARPPFVTPSRREARRQAREEARRREAFNALPQEEKDSLFSAQVGLARGAEGRFSGRGTARLARRRHAPPRFGEDAAARRGVPRRPDHGQEHRLAGLRRAQQAGLHLQQGRRHLPEQQPQGRLHAHRHGLRRWSTPTASPTRSTARTLSPNPNSPKGRPPTRWTRSPTTSTRRRRRSRAWPRSRATAGWWAAA